MKLPLILLLVVEVIVAILNFDLQLPVIVLRDLRELLELNHPPMYIMQAIFHFLVFIRYCLK